MEVDPDHYRCAQCGRGFPPEDFIGARGLPTRQCSDCRERYKPGTYGIRASVPPRRLRLVAPDGGMRVTWVPRSGNKKLGGIPAAIVSPETCPPSCGFYGKGCYAEFGASGHHWRNVERNGLTWDQFLERVRDLPAGQLWRYAVAGDLPSVGEDIDPKKLSALVRANRGKRGFTFTHKPLTINNRSRIYDANALGFTVNLSADSLHEADEKAAFGLPVVVVLDEAARGDIRTPKGRRVVVCPAQVREHVTCASCRLCSVSRRKGVVGFLAHGQMRKTVSLIAKGQGT